jgi:hypothetical protein
VEADTVLGKVEYVERIVEEADAVFVQPKVRGRKEMARALISTAAFLKD